MPTLPPVTRYAPALSLTPNQTNGEIVDLSTNNPAPVFEALGIKNELEWEVVTISKFRGGNSVFYDHVHQININMNKVSIILYFLFYSS